MLYDELASIHSDLAWALLELRLKPVPRAKDGADQTDALKRADAALDRLNLIIAVIAEVTQEKGVDRNCTSGVRLRAH